MGESGGLHKLEAGNRPFCQNEKRPSAIAGGRWAPGFGENRIAGKRLFGRDHLVLGRGGDFLEARQLAEARGLRLAGAAAGSRDESGQGGGQGEENTGHGVRCGIFSRNSEAAGLLGRGHVAGDGRSRGGLAFAAAGTGGERASRDGGQSGDLHEFHGVDRLSWLLRLSRPCRKIDARLTGREVGARRIAVAERQDSVASRGKVPRIPAPGPASRAHDP